MRSLRRDSPLSMQNYLFPQPATVQQDNVVAGRRVSVTGKTCTELMCGTLEEIRAFAERMNLGKSDEEFYLEAMKDQK